MIHPLPLPLFSLSLLFSSLLSSLSSLSSLPLKSALPCSFFFLSFFFIITFLFVHLLHLLHHRSPDYPDTPRFSFLFPSSFLSSFTSDDPCPFFYYLFSLHFSNLSIYSVNSFVLDVDQKRQAPSSTPTPEGREDRGRSLPSFLFCPCKDNHRGGEQQQRQTCQ